MTGYCGRAGALRRDQFVALEGDDSGLNGALGETGFIRDHAQTRRDRPPFLANGPTVQPKVDQERGRLLIVADQVAHKHVEYIVVDRHGFTETRHSDERCRYTDKRTTLFAVPNRSRLDALESPRLRFSTMISHLKFASIPVRDQNRALDFYTEKLGFTIVADKPFDDHQRWIELRIPKAETRIVLFTAEEHKNRIGQFTGLSFATDDVERTYELYKSRGVEFAGPPEKQPWGTYVIARDSEGNSFVIGTAK